MALNLCRIWLWRKQKFCLFFLKQQHTWNGKEQGFGADRPGLNSQPLLVQPV